MLKKIRIQELRVGMFVEQYGDGTFARPLTFPQLVLTSEEEVDRIVESGAAEVVIDTDKGAAPRSDQLPRSAATERKPSFHETRPLVPLYEELPVSEKLYSRSLEFSREVYEAARSGKPLDYRACEPFVNEAISSIERNESAAVTVTRISREEEYLYSHQVNVCLFALIFGRHLGLPTEELKILGMASMFHDIGKARIPMDILAKPAKLSDKEFEVAKRHTMEGYHLMKGQKGVHPDVLRVILEHHERFDGSGYPYALPGKHIGKFSRIVGLVDVFDALTSDRSYRKSMTSLDAFGLMYKQRSKDFAPLYVELFIKSLGIYPVGTFVRLNDGNYGVVSQVNYKTPLRPVVKVAFDRSMQPVRASTVDLSGQDGEGDKLEIVACLNPLQFNIDVLRLLS